MNKLFIVLAAGAIVVTLRRRLRVAFEKFAVWVMGERRERVPKTVEEEYRSLATQLSEDITALEADFKYQQETWGSIVSEQNKTIEQLKAQVEFLQEERARLLGLEHDDIDQPTTFH